MKPAVIGLMNKKSLLGISLAVVAVMMVASPALADESAGFSSIAKTEKKSIEAIVNSEDTIAEVGAYGFGVITSAGLEGIFVSTTHGGVLDSAAQTDASDASFHNHYVALQDSQNDGSGLCTTLEVRDITWDEPGDVTVLEDVAVFDGPTKFESTNSLTGEKVKFRTHGPVGAVVSFTITPVDGNGILSVDPIAAVCIDVAGAAYPLVDNSEPEEHHDDDDDDED